MQKKCWDKWCPINKGRKLCCHSANDRRQDRMPCEREWSQYCSPCTIQGRHATHHRSLLLPCQKGRVRNARLQAKDVGMHEAESHPIYLKEHLMHENNRLFSKALKLKKENKWQFLWTAGCLRARKTKDSKVLRIREEEDHETFTNWNCMSWNRQWQTLKLINLTPSINYWRPPSIIDTLHQLCCCSFRRTKCSEASWRVLFSFKHSNYYRNYYWPCLHKHTVPTRCFHYTRWHYRPLPYCTPL